MEKKFLLLLFMIIGVVITVCWNPTGSLRTVYAAEEDVYDIILFWGQSNMSGAVGSIEGESEPDRRILTPENSGISQTILNNTTAMNHVDVPVRMNTAYDFRYSLLDSDPLVPILSTTEILGENLIYSDGNLIPGYNDTCSVMRSQGTNMIPQFCSTYYEKTGHKVIAVMASRNGRSIDAFLPSDNPLNPYEYHIYEATKMKYNAAVNYAESQGFKIGSKFWVVYQGEADVRKMRSDENVDEYVDTFNQVVASFSEELGTEFGFVIECGERFHSDSSQISPEILRRVKRVKAAHEKIIKNNTNIMLGSNFPYRQYFAFNTNVVSNCDNNIHLTSAALSQVGYETAISVSNYVNGGFANSLFMDATEKRISVNDEFQLTCTVNPDSSLKHNLVWESSDVSVASVDASGNVKGLKAGTAVIVVKTRDGSNMAFCTVSVCDSSVKGVRVSLEELELKSGDVATLTAYIEPEDADNKNITWNSSDSFVATVEEGVVTAKYPGTAYISAMTDEGNYIATCKVVVTASPVTGVSIPSDVRINVGSVHLLYPEWKPVNGENKKLIWTSDNPAVAAVDEITGLITAYSEGMAQITATTSDGKFYATCCVTVLPKSDEEILVTELLPGAGGSALGLGDTCQLTATCMPEDATDKNVYWISSDNDIATVNQDGLVCGHNTGKVTITAIAGSSDVRTSFTLFVEPVGATGLAFAKASFCVPVYSEKYIIPAFVPSNASDKSLSFVSSNPDILTVDENGKVTAKSVGTVKLTAKHGENLQATCTIKVTPCMISEIKPESESITINENEEMIIHVAVLPETATNKSIRWNSSDTAVVTVDQSGKIKAVKEGTAMITASATDGSGTLGHCIVQVKKPEIKVQSITVSSFSSYVAAGRTLSLYAFILPSNATNQNVVWKSSNPDYARVSSDGTVTARTAGIYKSVQITATAKDGSGVKAYYYIKILPVRVSSIRIYNNSQITRIAAGKVTTLHAAVLPADAINKNVTWSSCSPRCATVTSDGVVIAKPAGVGKAVSIKATAKDGSGKYAMYKFIIMKSAVSSLSLSASSHTVKVGRTLKINPNVTTTGYGANTTLRWSSSNPEYATVSSTGVVKGCQKGVGKIVTITASSTDGSYKKATYRVRIQS